MAYVSIMVAVDDGRHAPERIRLAADLAQRFGARLIGTAACLPDYPHGYGETAAPMGMVIEKIRQATLETLARAERVFQAASSHNDRVSWRSDLADFALFLNGQSRAADLLVLGRSTDQDGAMHRMAIGLGDVLIGSGRPVLVVPPGIEHLDAKRVVLGWKNTPQTRRSISDAMPILRRAESVLVMRVADDDDYRGIEDVAEYLSLHDVNATTRTTATSGWTVAEELQKAAIETNADLIVTGAYGHTRLREWFLGGVTRDLLAGSSVCCLMSH
ncbi:MAG: universal stress protein [Parafilimonas terrae]|nr:universal stress protein [Parafilimonas terrae]